MSRPLVLTIWIWLLGFGLAVALEVVGQDGFIPAFVGASLVTVGVAGGVGTMVAPGLLILSLGAVIATRGLAPSVQLLVLALTGVFCAVGIQSASMSFLTRRENRLSHEVRTGFCSSIALAAAVGGASAMVVIGGVDSIRWPAWLLPVPLSIMAGGATWLAVRTIRDGRPARASGPGVRPPIRGRAASGPPPGALRP